MQVSRLILWILVRLLRSVMATISLSMLSAFFNAFTSTPFSVLLAISAAFKYRPRSFDLADMKKIEGRTRCSCRGNVLASELPLKKGKRKLVLLQSLGTAHGMPQELPCEIF